MYKLLISCLILILSINIQAEEFKNKKEYYYNQSIEIKGTKKSIKGIPFLFLPEPINVNPQIPDQSEGLDELEKNVKILHIAMNSKLNKIPNGCVILKGDLYHGFNINHKTNVLIHIDSYRLCTE